MKITKITEYLKIKNYFFHLCKFSATVARTFNSNWNGAATRRGRMSQLPTLAPSVTQNVLLKAYGEANNDEAHGSRFGK